MRDSDRVRDYVKTAYIVPARKMGVRTVTVRSGNICREMNWETKKMPQVCSALASQKFGSQAGTELVAKQGPPSGQSSTVEFTYRLNEDIATSDQAKSSPESGVGSGVRLMDLWGIFADGYKQLGGAEAFMRAERDAWGPDHWEKMEAERAKESQKAEGN